MTTYKLLTAFVALVVSTGCGSTTYNRHVNTVDGSTDETRTRTATSDDTTVTANSSAAYKRCWAEAKSDIIDLVDERDPQYLNLVVYWKKECYMRSKSAPGEGMSPAGAMVVPGYGGGMMPGGTVPYPMDSAANIALQRYPGAAAVAVPAGPSGGQPGGEYATKDDMAKAVRVLKKHDCQLGNSKCPPKK